MGLKCVSIFVLLAAIAVYFFHQTFLATVEVPKLDVNEYWGPSDRKNRADSPEIVPFKVQYSVEVIEKLRKRLAESLQLHKPLENVGFEYGFNTNKLEDVVKFWRDDYLPRWDERQKYLNSLPQFKTEIQGLKIHFIHTKDQTPKGKQLVPLLLLHGWPGSVREFYEIIPKLVATQKDLDVNFVIVAPSLPGYGFSDPPRIKGFGPAQIAVVFRNLMVKLGYNRFLIQGGDWGSIIGSNMATLFPENVIGYHSNLCISSQTSPLVLLKSIVASFYTSAFIPDEYTDLIYPVGEKFKFTLEESGYFHIQATKPDTIGTALAHNPVGLAAYILEKFSTWTNPKWRQLADGGLDKAYTKDALFDNVMLYYLTNSITTSVRLYAEGFSDKQRDLKLDRVPTHVPTGCARFRHDLMHQMDWQLRDKFPNLVHSTYHNDGGHFIAMEKPTVLYTDFVQFVKKLKF